MICQFGASLPSATLFEQGLQSCLSPNGTVLGKFLSYPKWLEAASFHPLDRV